MIRISQTLLNSKDDCEKQENYCHKEAFEYLPIAKGMTYDEICKGTICPLLTIHIMGGTEVEDKIINDFSWRQYIAKIRRAADKCTDNFKVLSISFNEMLNKSKEDGMGAQVLIDNNGSGELSEFDIEKFKRYLDAEINGIIRESRETSIPISNINATKPVDPILNTNEHVNVAREKEINNTNDVVSANPINTGSFSQMFARPQSATPAMPTTPIENVTENINTLSNPVIPEKANELNSDIEKKTTPVYREQTTMGGYNTMPQMNNFSSLFNAKPIESEIKSAEEAKEPEYFDIDKISESSETFFDTKADIDTIIPTPTDIPTDVSTPIIAKVPEKTFTKTPEPVVQKEIVSNFFDDLDDIDDIDTSEDEEMEGFVVEEIQLKEDNNVNNDINNNINNDINNNINVDNNVDNKKNDQFEEKIKDITPVSQAKDDLSDLTINKEQKNNPIKPIQNNNIINRREEKESVESAKKENTISDNKEIDNVVIQKDIQKEREIPLLNKVEKYIPTVPISIEHEETPKYILHEEDYDAKTTSSHEKLNKAYKEIMMYYLTNEKNTTRRAVTGDIEKDTFLNSVRAYIDRYMKIPVEDVDYLINKIERALYSYHVLIPAINDPAVSDIRIVSANDIIVKVHGKHYKADGLNFINSTDYENFIRNILIRSKVATNYPIIVFTDLDFCKDYIVRFNICLPAVNSTGAPYLHIRKVPKDKTTLIDLLKAEMLDANIASYLLEKVKTSKGLIFAGPSASGKTTLMNALVDYIPKSESILCIQESDELFTKIHPNAYFQHIVKDLRGNTIIGLSELGQNGLLCDSQYFIIGEVKGSEARDILRASNTGHKCWCSVHSQSSRETITRLADYVKLGTDYTLTEAERMLKDLEVIVYIEDFKVKEISEITGYDENTKKIIYKPIYRRDWNSEL